MNDEYMFIERALDANAFDTSTTTAGHVNATYWEKRLRDHVSANLVALQMGEDRSSEMSGDGEAFNFTIEDEPAAASATAESADASIDAISSSQITLTPTEYTSARQYTDKQARRAFFSVNERLMASIGYSLGIKADSLAISEMQTNAGNSVVANGVASSALASSDTLDHKDVVSAMKANASDKFGNHRGLIVSVSQGHDLMMDSTFLTADKYGVDKATARNGLIGFTAFAIPVFVTTQVPVASSKAKAILVSAPDAFLYGFKARGELRTDYNALGRYTNIVGAIDFDVAVARANALCTIQTWSA